MLTLLLLVAAQPARSEGWAGYAELKGFAYPEPSANPEPSFAGWGTLLLKREETVGEAFLTASLRAEGLTGEERGRVAFDPADRRLRRAPFSIRDFWVRYPLAPAVDLQAGRFQLGWGKTDGYSPADAFLPRDLSDPFADEKLPVWGLRLTGQNGPLRYEAVGLPVTTPWRLPVFGGRNAPISAAVVPPGTVFEERPSEPPVPGFAALRLLANLGAWDLGAWGRFGVRPAPLLDFRVDEARVTGAGVLIPVERRYAREEAAGVELSRVVGPWVLRAEAALLFSRDRALGNAAILSGSAERSFGDGTLLVTLAGNLKQTPVDPTLLFDRAILPALIVAWNRSEEWGGWKLVWSTGLKRGDGVAKGEWGYNLTDVWKLTLGGDLPYGSEKGAYGALRSARRLMAAVRRSW